RRAQAAGADVRLALRIRPPELAALPWEYLFDAREDRREFLGRSCMVTRSSGDLRTVPPLPVAGPLRVLAMVAVPGDQAELDVERERAYLEQALAPMRAAGRLELAWVPATKAALLSATQRQRWHIVHYIGHGDFDAVTGAGRLAFAADDGADTDWVTARQLAAVLGAHPTLRLVVLNACQSSAAGTEDGQAGLAAALVHAGLAAVVAMQFPITDDAAPVFGREFYGALAAGEPVDRCVRAGRAAITLANDASLEWGTPVLHLRSADGLLFAMEAEAGTSTGTGTGTGADARAGARSEAAGGNGRSVPDGSAGGAAAVEHPATTGGRRPDRDGSAAAQSVWANSEATPRAETTSGGTQSPVTSAVAAVINAKLAASGLDGGLWRPEPEQAPPTNTDDPVGTGRFALLQQIGMDLMQANDKVLDQRYSEELVADLERIVAGYVGLHGPEHPYTVSARKLLLKAKDGLEATSAAPPVEAPAPGAVADGSEGLEALDDPEDHFRSKTTRRAAAERQARAPRRSKAVAALPSADLAVGADVLHLTFSGGPARLLGIGTADGTAHLVAADTRTVQLPHGPAQPVRRVLFSPSEQNVVCLLGYGERPDRLRLWTADGRPMSQDGVIASHFAFHSADLFLAASGGHDLSLRRFATPFQPYMPYRGLAEVGDVAVSPDGQYVAAIGDHQILVWRALTGEPVGSFAAPEARLEVGIQFSADSSAVFASHTRSGLVRCDLATGRSTPCALPALADRRPVWALAPGGLAVGMPSFGESAAASFWDVAAPDIDLGRLPDEVCPTVCPAFDPAGKLLAVALPGRRTVRIYELEH
ncbi:MAG: CHAT domain-containing protein, partial [Catenulispora sp.]|nr:CHAT domain-containing protein [Catenulispora sp.]